MLQVPSRGFHPTRQRHSQFALRGRPCPDSPSTHSTPHQDPFSNANDYPSGWGATNTPCHIERIHCMFTSSNGRGGCLPSSDNPKGLFII